MKERFKIMNGKVPTPQAVIQYKRIPTVPVDWYPMAPERRRLWDYCGFVVHMMESGRWMTAQEIRRACDDYNDQYEEDRLDSQTFWNSVAVSVQGGFAEVRVRPQDEFSDEESIVVEEKDWENEGESLGDWS